MVSRILDIRSNSKHTVQLLPGTPLYNIYATCDPEGLHRCFGSFVSPEQDLVYAYRDYYRYKKSVIRNWKYTRRKEPAWLQIGVTTDAEST